MTDTPHAAAIAGHPLHAMFSSVTSTCFVGAFLTDLAYWRSPDMQWANFSAWLLTIGLLVAVLVVIIGAFDFFGDRRIRRGASPWFHAVGGSLLLVVEIFNALVHSRDAYTSVVPAGLALSAAGVVLLSLTSWNSTEEERR
jgi:uncharacterized membrane protein